MTKVEIKNRWTGAVLFSAEVEDGDMFPLRTALTRAISGGAYLRDANLRGANLGDANLGGANLGGAYLRDANLGGANLGGANLGDANLGGAYLRDANLGGANLGGAYLRDANLGGANLGGANLGGANLGGAYLRDANLGGAKGLDEIRDDIYEILSDAPREVPGLLDALRAGKIDGSCYQGDCACLVGTIANVRGCGYMALDGIEPNSSRPAERWFLAIQKGDKPATNAVAALTETWLEEWLLSNPVEVAS